ncbi:uncharacterized protein EI97DRAFT_459100 [Westerdykella ornata]|uniref:SET domain-containing protein n=1 Tax=Westerdykella ornata TaxID=318751 RepID=A0A6A6JGS9_WESOR|nr:uncharacterized protein EI97DRAFT_459100 [Westerdykella ornata]KAF2275632.1 hypothetical protein EI97DRAFT_459100 [Westerdykella ornata]
MTDVSPVKALADPQPASVVLYGDHRPPFTHASPTLDGTVEEEESSTIKCICGFFEDDGNTVLCEKCDTWQHIVCYYESVQHVPEIHECFDCHPRAIDKKRAVEKQLQRREQLHSIGERKGKPKTTSKNHKRRVKEPLASVHANGWAVHSNNDLHYGTERKSGSPRDQPPPSKRPKTTHRSSASVNIMNDAPALMPPSRKRASSTAAAQNGYSPVKSPTTPDGPNDIYSPEFMSLYRQQTPPSPDSNDYTDIGIANDLAMWLTDREELAKATGGLQPADVFQRINQPIEDLERMAPPILKQTDADLGVTAHGLHPQWNYLTVEAPVLAQSYIGELRGRIGRRQDYIQDPSNRWEVLRHPEPFVFFPPHLPIYLDTRQEGTLLRYVRRSCNPNVSMKIVTQGNTDFHFCLISDKNIEAGEELTMGWEVEDGIRQKISDALDKGEIKNEGLKKIEPWVACILSNFGGCACDRSRGWECLLERARRRGNAQQETNPPAKSSKGRKSKKGQASPLSTGHATNSRAGSETINRNGPEDDNMDARSTSGSHKSTSRDITPSTHFSVDAGDLKLSDRERRKIQQSEQLFNRMEYEELHRGKRGKRNSAGSNLNTPSLPSSKQLGHSEPSPTARTPREHNHGVARKASGTSRAKGRTERKPKPVYVDSSTQTDGPDSCPNAIPVPPANPGPPRRPVRFVHRLLQMANQDRLKRLEQEECKKAAFVKAEARSPALRDVMSNKRSPSSPLVPKGESSAMDTLPDAEPVPAPVGAPTVAKTEPETASVADVVMKDAEPATLAESAATPSSSKIEEMPDAPEAERPPEAPQPSMLPPLLPSSSTVSIGSATTPAAAAPPSKPVDLHLQLPPPDMTHPAVSLNSASTPGSVSGAPIAQSPISLPTASPMSPAVGAAANPPPVRKKMSLSDYTNRRAKLAQTQSSGASATPTMMQSHLASSPTLSTASLPSQTSPPPAVKPTEPSTLTTVTEEAKSES